MRELNKNLIQEINGGWVIIAAGAVIGGWLASGGGRNETGPSMIDGNIRCASGQNMTVNSDGSGSCTTP